jgi:hypothetical protein
MANQMIALQTRNPQLPDPSKMTAQYATMMNLAQQNETSKRQAAQAQQQMDFAAAKEGREKEMQPFAAGKAKYEAFSAQQKAVLDFMAVSYETIKRSRSPEDVVNAAGRLKQNFPDPVFADLIDQTVATLPADPSQFSAWKKQSEFDTLSNVQRLEQVFKTQNTGTEQREIAMPKYGGGAAVEVPGSRFAAAQGKKFIRDANGAVYSVDDKTGGGFDTPAPAVGTPAPRGAPGQGNTADVVYGFGDYGLPDKPLSTMRMGDVQNFQKELINKTRGKVGAGPKKGTGAVGTYQFTYETLQDMAPKVFGANWRDKPFTADAQEKLAKALYEERKGGNLKDTWAGLPSNRPGQYANVPWEQVRDKIIQVESAGGGNRRTPTGGASAAAPGGPVQILPGKPAKEALTPEKRLARDTAVQNLFDDIQAAQKKGHLVSEKQSYIANRAAELRRGRPYAPGGTAQKTSLDKIDATATQLLRQFIEKGTSGTLNTKVEQENFLKGVGGGDSTYETRIDTLRNFAKQNGIKINEGGATKSKAAPPKVATPTTKAPPGISPEDWKYMSPAERKLWVK